MRKNGGNGGGGVMTVLFIGENFDNCGWPLNGLLSTGYIYCLTFASCFRYELTSSIFSPKMFVLTFSLFIECDITFKSKLIMFLGCFTMSHRDRSGFCCHRPLPLEEVCDARWHPLQAVHVTSIPPNG